MYTRDQTVNSPLKHRKPGSEKHQSRQSAVNEVFEPLHEMISSHVDIRDTCTKFCEANKPLMSRSYVS